MSLSYRLDELRITRTVAQYRVRLPGGFADVNGDPRSQSAITDAPMGTQRTRRRPVEREMREPGRSANWVARAGRSVARPRAGDALASR
jgi:hypothetical protein